MKEDIAALLDDTDLGVATVSWRLRVISGGGSATFSPATGTITDPYTTKTITAMVGAPKDEDAKRAGVDLMSTDRKIMTNLTDLTAEPCNGDVVVISSDSFDVLKVYVCQVTGIVVAYLRKQGGEAR